MMIEQAVCAKSCLAFLLPNESREGFCQQSLHTETGLAIVCAYLPSYLPAYIQVNKKLWIDIPPTSSIVQDFTKKPINNGGRAGRRRERPISVRVHSWNMCNKVQSIQDGSFMSCIPANAKTVARSIFSQECEKISPGTNEPARCETSSET